MPDQVLRNPRHERFAQELATGKTADVAYVLAGYDRGFDPAAKGAELVTALREVLIGGRDKPATFPCASCVRRPKLRPH